MPRLSNFPAGFLSLLGVQNFGEAPNQLGDVVQPIIDTTSLYLQTAQRIVNDNGVVAAGPNNLTNGNLLVPAGELWYVHRGDCQAFAGAGATCDIQPALVMNGVTMMLAGTLVVAATQTRSTVFDAPFFMPAGSRLVIYASNVAGGPAPTVAIEILVSKFRAA